MMSPDPVRQGSPRPSVVVLGSLHLDVVVAAPRLPRPGETLPGTGMALVCGGKGGNQAVAAARHGARVAMVGCVGHDAFGPRLRAGLQEGAVDHCHVRESRRPSGTSVAIADPAGEYGAVIVSGANLELGEADVAAAGAVIDGALVLVLQNEVPEAANVAAAARAARHGVSVVLNAAPARALPEALLASLSLLVVNAVEAEMLGAGPVASLQDARRAARMLWRRLPRASAAAIVTAGRAGVAAHARDVAGQEGGFASAAHRVTVVGMHGAGDAFVGALAACLAGGAEMPAAIRYANAAAALAVAAAPEARARIGPAEVRRLMEAEAAPLIIETG